jgi:predicted O-methyltransferase YrrM
MELPWRDLAPGDGPLISTSITEAEAARLAELAAGKRVLEVGAAYGFSTVTLALRATRVTSVDPHQWLPSYGPLMRNLYAYGVTDRVNVYVGSSFEALPTLADVGQQFDLIFIDGDHAEQTVAHDIGWAIKLLASGGVLACHDWDEVSCPGVRVALERTIGPPPELIDTLAVYPDLAA